MNDKTWPGMMLLPPSPDVCPECARKHALDVPHDALSLHYQYFFRSHEGRWPTWKDAIAHCTPEVREFWEKDLREMGKWTEPESDIPDVIPCGGFIGTVQIINADDEIGKEVEKKLE